MGFGFRGSLIKGHGEKSNRLFLERGINNKVEKAR